jgi:hypothetical protein
MRIFVEQLDPSPDSDLIDIGGLPDLWRMIPRRPKVTLLNLPGSFDFLREEQRRGFKFIEANIFEHPNLTAAYDIAFSNSVLEHVGPREQQAMFADIVCRAPAYWVQVPSPSFPIEQHCHAFFWWQRGQRSRDRVMRRWSMRGDDLSSRFMQDTRPISRSTLQSLFPDAKILTEQVLGFEKSIYAFRPRENA